MEFSVDLLNTLAKRGWKIIVWVLPINIIFSLYFTTFIIIKRGLYSINKIANIDTDISSLLSFLIQNIVFSFFVIFVFYIIKGDSGDKIKKLRSKFYTYSRDRVFNLFAYRYTSLLNIDKDIDKLVSYNAQYKKEKEEHSISEKFLSFNDLPEIDSLYIIYKINNIEKVLFSIWHTGNKISVAIAFDKNDLFNEFKYNLQEEIFNNITSKYKGILNISDAKDTSIQIREKYYWFDIVYEVSEEFLVNNIEKEDISRKIAHIVTVGLPVAMSLMGWNAKQ